MLCMMYSSDLVSCFPSSVCVTFCCKLVATLRNCINFISKKPELQPGDRLGLGLLNDLS